MTEEREQAMYRRLIEYGDEVKFPAEDIVRLIKGKWIAELALAKLAQVGASGEHK